jgi:hypothetical protein
MDQEKRRLYRRGVCAPWPDPFGPRDAQDEFVLAAVAQNPRRFAVMIARLTAADWSVLLPFAWPENISNQKMITASTIATVAAILVTTVILLIRKLGLYVKPSRSRESR